MIEGQNLEAEKDLLSVILNDQMILTDNAEKIHPDLFTDPFHQKIISTVRSHLLENTPIEISTLSDNKNEQHVIRDIKIRDKDSAFFDSFYKILEECLVARNLKGLISNIKTQMSRDDNILPSDILHKIKNDLDSMEQLRSSSMRAASEIIDKVVDRHLDVYEHVKEGKEYKKEGVIESPFSGLNKLLKREGFDKESLVIIAAPTSIGKTELVLNFASYAGIEKEEPGLIYSLEMGDDSLVERILLERSRVDSFKLERGLINEVDIQKLNKAATEIKSSNLIFEKNLSADIFDIVTSIRKAHYKHNIKFVVIDYIQLVKNPAYGNNRNDEVASVSRILKQEATRLGIPIFALSQLSRRHMIEGREPNLADLRDSGAIEQDADIVIFLYASSIERKNTVQAKTKCILAKQREGPIGELFLMNHKTIQTFEEITELEFKRGNKPKKEDDEQDDIPF